MVSGPLHVQARAGFAEIRLEETPSTGYVWHLEANPALSELERRFEPSGASREVGGSGVRVFRLKLNVAPPCHARFVLKRPWEQRHIEQREFVIA